MKATTTLIILFVILQSESTPRFCTPARNKPSCQCGEQTGEVTMFCHIDDIHELCTLNCGRYVPYLKHLNMFLNDITTLLSSHLAFKNLRFLEISGNVLTLIQDRAFEGLEKKLEHLHVNNTYLQQIPTAAIMNLTKLSTLNLNRNQIRTIEESVGSLSLHHLHLSGNNISRIERGMLPPTLESLDLRNNHLSSLNGSLKVHISSLWQLDISENFLINLTGELTEVHKLRYLTAEKNNIETIDDGSLWKHYDLELLYLAHNNIFQIRDGLKGLDSLEVLDVSYNELHHIDATAFDDLIALEELDLQHNHLGYLSESLFYCLSSLQDLYISYNRLHNLNFLVSPSSAIDWKSGNIDMNNLDKQDGITCVFYRGSTTLYNLRMLDKTVYQFSLLTSQNKMLRYLAPNSENDIENVEKVQHTFNEYIKESGVRCNDEVNQIIDDLKLSSVDIKGNPCETSE